MLALLLLPAIERSVGVAMYLGRWQRLMDRGRDRGGPPCHLYFNMQRQKTREFLLEGWNWGGGLLDPPVDFLEGGGSWHRMRQKFLWFSMKFHWNLGLFLWEVNRLSLGPVKYQRIGKYPIAILQPRVGHFCVVFVNYLAFS